MNAPGDNPPDDNDRPEALADQTPSDEAPSEGKEHSEPLAGNAASDNLDHPSAPARNTLASEPFRAETSGESDRFVDMSQYPPYPNQENWGKEKTPLQMLWFFIKFIFFLFLAMLVIGAIVTSCEDAFMSDWTYEDHRKWIKRLGWGWLIFAGLRRFRRWVLDAPG